MLTNPSLSFFLFQDYPNSFNPTTSTSSSLLPVHGILLRCTAQLAVFYRHSWVVFGNNHHHHYHLLSILKLPSTTIPPPYSIREPLQKMEPRRTPPEYFLEIFADTTSVRDVLKGTLFLYLLSCFFFFFFILFYLPLSC